MDTAAVEALIRQCQRALPDDTRAFEALVRQFSRRVYAMAYRLVGDVHEADDMAQEVFLKVFRGLKDLSDAAAFVPWLYRITTTTCLDYLDKKKHRPPTTLHAAPTVEDAALVADSRTPSPEEAALRAEIRECIERTLAGLSGVERAVLVLRDVEGRPYQEIAESLALGLSAVKMRIHRARLAFGQVLARICPDTWRRYGPAPALESARAGAGTERSEERGYAGAGSH